ncbi:hypothetical protein OKA05_24145 [Luteolibacter arcticus]|uniref:PEP-CTERM sorting domain-containing protein n=1 Tax=Luteolibacter arcticus TaxID=1581411 RepID=A0ABT3GQ81_9BACT|nr:hypothetical protein [Luteolibacter arcticus]MCW1925671.1 hypothetical protein [Luteolibacter arcticus]
MMHGIPLWLLSSVAASAVTVLQVDDFSAGRGQWRRGTINNEEPQFPGDPYLMLTSDGAGPGGKLITFNDGRWEGNYISAGVSSLSLDAVNFSGEPLSLRIAFGDTTAPFGGSGTWWVATFGILLDPQAGWQPLAWSLDESSFTRVQGEGSFGEVMSNVKTLRVLHGDTISPMGTNVVGGLGIDNVRAIPEPASHGILTAAVVPWLLRRRRGLAVSSRSATLRRQ